MDESHQKWINLSLHKLDEKLIAAGRKIIEIEESMKADVKEIIFYIISIKL